MRAPISWLREWVELDPAVDSRQIYQALVRAGLEVETVERVGPEVTGPVVVGRVLSVESEPQKNGKTIRWCRVDCGPEANAQASQPAPAGQPGSRGIVCGAPNVAPGQLVVVALPGATLPGGFAIAARKTYGHISDGMICAEDELGLGDDHAGIMVLPESDDRGQPLCPGQPALPLIASPDEVLDIAVTPDMGYCLSIRGIARELAQAFGAPFRDPADRPTPEPKSDGCPVRLDTAACPVFVAVTVEGVDPARPSPRWLVNRLRLSGMRPLGLAVDITNYVMLEIGQPIHGYDGDRLNGGIQVRPAAAGEVLVTLDGVPRQLDPQDIVIADGSGVIGLAGVMGGQSTELGPTTSRVVIEAANFDALAIARTSKRHKLSSEASRRFERGVDPAAAYSAAHRVADLLVELGAGRVSAAETVAGRPPARPERTMPVDLPTRVLGHPIPPSQVEAILRASGVTVQARGDELVLTPPTWRPDLVDRYDYVEEVGRKIGFDVIRPVVPTAPPGRGRTPAQRLRQALGWALPATGFSEVISFPFVGPSDLDRLGLAPDDPRRATVRLANPLADTSPDLRTSLLPGLFAAVARNTSRGLDDLALYEQGSVFFGPAGPAPSPSLTARPSDQELAAIDRALPRQPRHLACVLTGQWRPAGWSGPARPAGWVQAVAFAETAARAVGLELTRRAVALAPWHPGRCAELRLGDRVIGQAGEIHPSVAEAFGLPQPTAAAELDLDALIELAPGPGRLPVLATFPVAKEDVALIVPEDTPQAEVAQTLREGAGPLLESLALFDVYSGQQIGPGLKSLAFALRFRAPDRTLTEAEAAQARDRAVAWAVERHGAVPRVAEEA
ncbi:MAG: phenylalanine--tRNA ligase subunit beta [Propionibacteriaceae bacterium]|jgi:phenylalanyl-tRNA synthetase beta chain|nr:phenylalanine--tRNA ligase subunit beta [Propionibacteriaceae bacterium]